MIPITGNTSFADARQTKFPPVWTHTAIMSWNPASTAIIGSGAIGIYYGARLAGAGHDVRFLVRSDADAVRAHGLRVDSIHGDLHLPAVRSATSAGIHTSCTLDLEEAQWEKLVWNIPFNGLCIAEGGVTTDLLLANPRTCDGVREIMREVIHAARALGHPLRDALVEEYIERTRLIGGYRPSSLIDYLEGREIEMDAIWAEPIRRARAVGAAMPATAALLERIRQRCAAAAPAAPLPPGD